MKLDDDDAVLAMKVARDDQDTLVVKTSMGGEQRINTAALREDRPRRQGPRSDQPRHARPKSCSSRRPHRAAASRLRAHREQRHGTEYTAKDITVLEGLDPVRKRPGMYIGGVGSAGLHHLVWEIVDNSVDEAMNGHATEITVTLHKDGSSVTVSDNGRGIPVDMHPKHKKTALEIIFSTLHAGGKFEAGNYKTAGGLHGVGASVVNALSTKLVATVKRDGAEWQMEFKRGVAHGPAEEARRRARHRHDRLLPARSDHLPAHRVRPRDRSASASRSRASCTAA